MSNLKIGVFGAGRGMFLAADFMLNGCDVVAVCDKYEDRVENAKKRAVQKGKPEPFGTLDYKEILKRDTKEILKEIQIYNSDVKKEFNSSIESFILSNDIFYCPFLFKLPVGFDLPNN